MGNVDRTIRLSQSISPFGVGAIYDVMGESLVACETYYWKGKGRKLEEPRLASHLGKDHFEEPPFRASIFRSNAGGKIPFERFPSWLFCPKCRQMYRWGWNDEVEGEPPKCKGCRGRKLVPMRFIMICENGHMSDVPWGYWVHRNGKTPEQKQCRSKNLRFITLSGQGGGLKSLQIECKTCGIRRSMHGITGRSYAEHNGLDCRGKQPWQKNGGDCDVSPRIVQRGASSVHYPEIATSIDIPPFSRRNYFGSLALEVTNHKSFHVLGSTDEPTVRDHMSRIIAGDVRCSPEDVMKIFKNEESKVEGKGPSIGEDTDDLRIGEWRAFLNKDPDQTERDRFVTDHVGFLPSGETRSEALRDLENMIDRVVVARKLREVRALTGFYRVKPGGEINDGESKNRKVFPDGGRNLDWLPATEVFGEGVFLSIDEERLQQWESDPHIKERAAILEDRREQSTYGTILPKATARFMMIHTVAHLLIRQLSFECGYASSSLRERIYCRTPGDGDAMAGILIYTAAGDVEGTLGGLARQGEPPRLARTLLSALQRAKWCSSDPICAESTGQGLDGLNLGACHACSLVSETSCTNFNLLLDRAMVIGGRDKINGFFSSPLNHALNSSSSKELL